jgi:hypothetical protein
MLSEQDRAHQALMIALTEACHREILRMRTPRLTGKERRADDLCKGAVGAWIGKEMAAGRTVVIACADDLLTGLDGFIVGDSMREAVLGSSGKGSESFHRVYVSQQTEADSNSS